MPRRPRRPTPSNCFLQGVLPEPLRHFPVIATHIIFGAWGSLANGELGVEYLIWCMVEAQKYRKTFHGLKYCHLLWSLTHGV